VIFLRRLPDLLLLATSVYVLGVFVERLLT
jgi:hypothetical protein